MRKFLWPFLLLVGSLFVVACTEERKPSDTEEPIIREQLQVLRLRAGANPMIVAAGEETEIDLLVTDVRGRPLSNVNVEVAVADGAFTATGQTVIVGPTNGRGEFRTIWKAPKPSLSGYKFSFKAEIPGQAEGREELLVLVEK